VTLEEVKITDLTKAVPSTGDPTGTKIATFGSDAVAIRITIARD